MEGGYGRPILVEEKQQRAARPVGGGIMEMRSMMIVAVMGLLSAVLYAREPSRPAVVMEAESTMGATPIPPPWTQPPPVVPMGTTVPPLPTFVPPAAARYRGQAGGVMTPVPGYVQQQNH
jgi:hypothetical protein